MNDYLIVHKKILPSYFEKVVEVRDLIEKHKCKSVSEATKRVGISRSTYYKYKDYIFTFTENSSKRFMISLSLEDEAGTLSDILATIFQSGANIITIHQDVPINHHAIVVITLDASNTEESIDTILLSLKNIKHVNDIKLLSLE